MLKISLSHQKKYYQEKIKIMTNIEFIEGVKLSNLCDYSFGDQSSVICGVTGAWMKPANITNTEFIHKVNLIKSQRNYMTLFIDNIRLYNRPITVEKEFDQNWINNLMSQNDLLQLCSLLPEINFIIYTNLEDTPIDSQIQNKIPKNVLKIFAVNSIYNDEIVRPFPYGVQRKLNYFDNKIEVLRNTMTQIVEPEKLMYVNHNISTNVKERSGIYELFEGQDWATNSKDRISYDAFLRNIQLHQFMICPIGNAIDCHRNWEVLYLRRVPIMKKNDYLEILFEEFPVLFVNDYSEITENLLIDNYKLFNEAKTMSLDNLDLNKLFVSTVEESIKIINN